MHTGDENMAEKKTMWGGRFSEDPDEFMVEFAASIDVDIELLDVDIAGSLAWTEALGRACVLAEDEVRRICAGLETVRDDLKSRAAAGTLSLDSSLEDVHMTVEAMLTELLGDLGARLHTGRSRNDQVALDERLYLLRAVDSAACAVRVVQKEIVDRARCHVDDFLPSYTHLQRALPVRLGHYLMSWFWMLERDVERFRDARTRIDCMPLGSGAAAGSGFPVDRAFLAGKLGFTRISDNSIDAVSDRDYIVETVSAASLLMMHLSRIAEDLIVWSSAEFGFVRLSDRYSTGSSMMPQKKNPDSLELVRGKTGRVYGGLVSLLTMMKALPFSYCRDMQEDKEPLFDALATVNGCLRITAGVIGELTFETDRMAAAIDETVFATDIADELTVKGIPFRKAHEMAGKLVGWSIGNGVPLSEIPDDVVTRITGFDRSIFSGTFDPALSADRRSLPGGTGKKSVLDQIAKADGILEGGDGS